MENTFCNISNINNCDDLLKVYKSRKEKPKGRLLFFDLEEKNDLFFSDQQITVYNPTKPIIKNGKKYLLARVETKDSEKSKVIFFVQKRGKWQRLNHPTFDLQDPFYIKNIQGWQVLGGVKIYEQDNGVLGYRTVFYKYKKCATELVDQNGSLKTPFATSPNGMKDIRLIELKNGSVGVFTRPQGGEAGLGKIAYVEIKSLYELERKIPEAKIIKNQFNDDEWGGANELHLLGNGKIGVLGHIAQFDKDIRHYYAMSFVFDPIEQKASELEILTTADEFPKVKSKKPDLGKLFLAAV